MTDDMERKRQALLAMQPQSREAHKEVAKPPELKPDLSQLRPIVKDSARQAEANARQVFGAAMSGFMGLPGVRAQLGADSELLGLYKKVSG
jgi:hypothetical protein